MLYANYTASKAREESNKFKALNSEPTIDQINKEISEDFYNDRVKKHDN